MILFAIKEAFKSLARAKFAFLITTVTMLLASLFFTLSVFAALESRKIENNLRDKIEIRLFLKDDISQSEVAKFKNSLLKDKRISRVIFKSKKDAALDLKKSLGSDFIDVLGENPLPASFILHINPRLDNKEINKLIEEFKKRESVSEVVYDKEEILFILKTIFYLKLGIYIFALISIIVSLYLLFSVNRLVFETRRRLYVTMKLFGAKLSTIRMPVFFNSLLISTFTVMVGIVVIIISEYLLNKFLPNINFGHYFLKIIIVYTIGSYLFGITGGIFSAGKINLKIER